MVWRRVLLIIMVVPIFIVGMFLSLLNTVWEEICEFVYTFKNSWRGE